MPSGSKVVAVAFDLNFRHAAEIYTGVVDHVRENRLDWQLVPLNFGFEAQLMDLARSGRLHGAIGTFVSDRWVAGLTELGITAVNLFHFSEIRSVPTVSVDDQAIGRLAAGHLRAQGARRFAFCGSDGHHASILRYRAYADALAPAPVQRLDPGASIGEKLSAAMCAERPLGVYCTNDRLARKLIRPALDMNLAFGKDLMIVGTDNEPSESVFAGIGISSIAIPARQIGREAGRALDQAFSGTRKSPPDHRLIPPVDLVARSSSLPHGRPRIAQRAANLILENLPNPQMDVNLLARETGVSRRSLEIAFQTRFNTSPYRYLARARLSLANELLRTTHLPVAEIGRRCGYPEPHHFSAWFKKQTGHAPKAARG
ncbi:MAG: substrate-binding domain-containing protein [Verrucomicrobiota bacterium]